MLYRILRWAAIALARLVNVMRPNSLIILQAKSERQFREYTDWSERAPQRDAVPRNVSLSPEYSNPKRLIAEGASDVMRERIKRAST